MDQQSEGRLGILGDTLAIACQNALPDSPGRRDYPVLVDEPAQHVAALDGEPGWSLWEGAANRYVEVDASMMVVLVEWRTCAAGALGRRSVSKKPPY